MTDRIHAPAVHPGRALKLAAFAASALLLSGCAYWPAAGNNGAFYTNVTRPIAVLDKQALATRTGEACSTGILGLYTAGNSSINTAKAKAGITEIHTVEERFTHYLAGAYTKYCTIVSGT
ncbi:MAG: TRL-like family protein [Alphaproteobacteria bacterium]